MFRRRRRRRRPCWGGICIFLTQPAEPFAIVSKGRAENALTTAHPSTPPPTVISSTKGGRKKKKKEQEKKGAKARARPNFACRRSVGNNTKKKKQQPLCIKKMDEENARPELGRSSWGWQMDKKVHKFS